MQIRRTHPLNVLLQMKRSLSGRGRLARFGLVAAAMASGLCASALAQTVTPPASPASLETPVMPMPDSALFVQKSLTPAKDEMSEPLITSTISNAPIPDSEAARKAWGGPDSASGKATAPQPGPVTTHVAPAKPKPAPPAKPD
jgi:hypothetical protein